MDLGSSQHREASAWMIALARRDRVQRRTMMLISQVQHLGSVESSTCSPTGRSTIRGVSAPAWQLRTIPGSTSPPTSSKPDTRGAEASDSSAPRLAPDSHSKLTATTANFGGGTTSGRGRDSASSGYDSTTSRRRAFAIPRHFRCPSGSTGGRRHAAF